jgi:hypothetical protein
MLLNRHPDLSAEYIVVVRAITPVGLQLARGSPGPAAAMDTCPPSGDRNI